MTLTQNRYKTDKLNTGDRIWRTHGLAADAVIYAGAMVALNASGYLVPASADTTLEVIGIAEGAGDNTGGSNGDVEVQVDIGAIGLFENGDSITIANVGDDAYAADDQTVTKGDGGVSQVTTATLVFNGTDNVGIYIDGYGPISVACVTDAATTLDAFLVEYAKHKWANDLASIAEDGTKITLSFTDKAAHTVTAYKPATADFTPITNTTAGVAPTKPRAGKIHKYASNGVYVDFRH